MAAIGMPDSLGYKNQRLELVFAITRLGFVTEGNSGVLPIVTPRNRLRNLGAFWPGGGSLGRRFDEETEIPLWLGVRRGECRASGAFARASCG